jgi:pimeloyl-ACP methyl ester carboxylesterase
MKLFYRELDGTGSPILILHGLFGSSKNWMSIGKDLTSFGKVYLLDARNHGDSPHSEEHNLQAMSEDVREFIYDNGLSNVTLLGHSMGGLTAIQFALTYPEILKNLIVVDIAPRYYKVNYQNEFMALEIDVTNMSSRQEIDTAMSTFISDPFIRKFLQMNLEKTETGYRWKLNVQNLKNNYPILSPSLINSFRFEGKTLFVLGGKSEYIQPEDKNLVNSFFPKVLIETIPNAGHYMHYLNSVQFISIIKNFIGE